MKEIIYIGQGAWLNLETGYVSDFGGNGGDWQLTPEQLKQARELHKEKCKKLTNPS